MASETKSGLVKVKSSSHQDGSFSKGKIDVSVNNKKKIESSSKHQPSDSKPKSSSTIMIKTEVKAKSTPSSSKTTTTTTTKVKAKREKKVYSLPGQKFDLPEEREPLRIFYESLSEQIPQSEMAEFWMMEHGLLTLDKAKKALEKKQRKQKQLWTGTPVKTPPPTRNKPESSQRQQPQQSRTKPESSQRQQPPQPSRGKPEISQRQQPLSPNGDAKAKRKIDNADYDDEDDFILSHRRRKG